MCCVSWDLWSAVSLFSRKFNLSFSHLPPIFLLACCAGQEGRILPRTVILRFNSKTKKYFSPTRFSSSEKVKLADCRYSLYLLCFSELKIFFFFAKDANVAVEKSHIFVLLVCVCPPCSLWKLNTTQHCWYLCFVTIWPCTVGH